MLDNSIAIKLIPVSLLSTRSVVTFQSADNFHYFSSNKLYCLITEARVYASSTA